MAGGVYHSSLKLSLRGSASGGAKVLWVVALRLLNSRLPSDRRAREPPTSPQRTKAEFPRPCVRRTGQSQECSVSDARSGRGHTHDPSAYSTTFRLHTALLQAMKEQQIVATELVDSVPQYHEAAGIWLVVQLVFV